MLEPDEGKLSSPVLRGLSGRKAARLPGEARPHKKRGERDGELGRAFDKAVSNGPPLWGGYMTLKLLKSSAWKVQVSLSAWRS